MDAKVIGILATASFGAIIASIGYLIKIKREQRRATRTVLFYLLELHHLFSRFHFSVMLFPSHYAEICKAAFTKKGLPFTDVEAKLFSEVIEQTVRNSGVFRIDEFELEIAMPFTVALTELSREDPLLAYRLKGKESISKSTKLIQSYLLSATNDPQDKAAVKDSYPHIDDIFRQFVMNELVRSIHSVAWYCGILPQSSVISF